jgi:hypothetical protein
VHVRTASGAGGVDERAAVAGLDHGDPSVEVLARVFALDQELVPRHHTLPARQNAPILDACWVPDHDGLDVLDLVGNLLVLLEAVLVLQHHHLGAGVLADTSHHSSGGGGGGNRSNKSTGLQWRSLVRSRRDVKRQSGDSRSTGWPWAAGRCHGCQDGGWRTTCTRSAPACRWDRCRRSWRRS